jgi:uncharacterized delta-60 repeat protein
MRQATRNHALSFLCVLLAACGGGGGSEEASIPVGTIGPAGGTVTGPAGARVVVPAGALTQNTAIAIAQSSSGAPLLPTGMTAAGDILAFTPHGTTFAAAATLRVPFDPSRVPAGVTPTLLKTNAAQNAWEVVSGTTVDGSTLNGQVTSFSYLVVAIPTPLTELDKPSRFWEFGRIFASGVYERFSGTTQNVRTGPPAPEGELLETEDFGILTLIPEGRDGFASGEVFSSADGGTYWTESEAPVAADRFASPETTAVGSRAVLIQKQSYRKNSPQATLTLRITEASILAIDLNGSDPEFAACPLDKASVLCRDVLKGEIEFHVMVVSGAEGDGSPTRAVHHWSNGRASLVGFEDHYFPDVNFIASAWRSDWDEYSQFVNPDDLPAGKPLWNISHFSLITNNGSRSKELTLTDTLRVPVDLSAVALDAEFTLDVRAYTKTLNRRARESYLLARFRDPIEIGGVSMEYDGLTPTNRPVLSPISLAPRPKPVCTAGDDPDSGTLQFSAGTYLAREFDTREGVIFVTRTGGARGEARATITSSDGTGIGGTHYQSVSQLIEFGDGDDVPRMIGLPIIDNATEDGDVTVNLILTTPAGCATLGAQSTAVLTIIDNEVPLPLPETFTVGGSVSGLAGEGLVLEDIEAGVVVTPTADGPFAFNFGYQNAAAYEVRVRTQPTNPIQVCSVGNDTGVIAGANVTNISVSCTTPSAPGSLDPAFGNDGRATGGLPGGADAMALQSDGKILLLNEFVLTRYNSDGSIDPTFGTAGQASPRFLGASTLTSLAVQSDGRIVVGGRSGRSLADGLVNFGLVRLNTDGSIDTTFGSAGFVYTDFNGNSDTLENVLIQGDGRIVAAGNAAVPVGTTGAFVNALAAARYTSTGALDASFGGGGTATQTATIEAEQEACLAFAATLQPNDAIVFAGRLDYDDDRGSAIDTCVTRFTANGARDSTFGEEGVVVIDYAEGNPSEDDDDQSDEAVAVAVQPDGKIVLVGHEESGIDSDFLVARLNADGSRDDAFGNAGAIKVALSSENDVANAVALQADGAIVVAGTVRIPGPPAFSGVPDFAIVRIAGNGTPDPDFGNGGTLFIDFFGASDQATAVEVQNDGRIVAAGPVRNGTVNDVGLVRILP